MWDELNWERREFAPRREYWWNAFGQDYTYGKGVGARTYHSQSEHEFIEEINFGLHIHGYVNRMYEGCFLNGYETKKDALGWHADDDPGIDHSRPIAVVTLYDKNDAHPRMLQVMEKATGIKRSYELEQGSLLLMHPGMQDTHLHRIPKAGFESRPRISLTYRGLIRKD
jgi:alkylated DNA repair dioxygenase AlkB